MAMLKDESENDQSEVYRRLITTLKALVDGRHIDKIQCGRMKKHIDDWKSLSQIKGREEDARALQMKIESSLYQARDQLGSKRVVELYIFAAGKPEPVPPRIPLSRQMTLMDYLYFAMYTITTTGYGDIRPTTTYSKFLCTLANMTEFFFIVVFFNSLLSLKKGKGDLL